MYELSEIEVRVLGCLIEKSITTPDYYPITLNALTTACNQKSNRFPVMDLEDKVVLRALDELRHKKFASMIHQANSRVPKYQHHFEDVLNLSDAEVAILCELMIRGPQTPGELRQRASRMHSFDSLAEVGNILEHLCERNEGLLVKQLPRQAGRKESRYCQLLAGEPDIDEMEAAAGAAVAEPVRVSLEAENKRMEALELEVEKLKQEMAALQKAFSDFREMFE